ncbi:MAG TPA: DUF2490 domain-containing protein [Flavobacteriales bacterium]|nr:DUF2490 domain-containing protein [Flavobacteriales bacterium]
MIKRLFILVFFTCAGVFTFAQRINTFETWFSAAVQVKSNDFAFTAEEGWRVREFYLSRQTYTDLNFGYKLNKAFNISAGYRLILKPHLFSISESNSRFYTDATFTHDAGELDFSARIRLQYTTLGQEDDFDLPSETYFRNKLRARYKINDIISIAAGYEMLLILAPGLNIINENRFSVEAQLKLNKHNALSIGYAVRNYIQVEDPLNVHVIGIDYVYKL